MARRKSYRILHTHRRGMEASLSFIDRAGVHVATVYADYAQGNITQVIFQPCASKTDKVNVLAACVDWANREHSLENRPHWLAQPQAASEAQGANKRRSQIMMATTEALLACSAKELTEFLNGGSGLSYRRPQVYELRYSNLQHVERCINARNPLKGRARVRIKTPPDIGWRNQALVTVTITDPNRRFEFWNLMDMPSQPSFDKYCFDIIPDYHPCRTAGRKRTLMVNGSTEALVNGWASVMIYPPENARRLSEYEHANIPGRGTWSYLIHPVLAAGTSFTMELDATLLRTRVGADLVVGIVATALDDTSEYIGVSGGFCAPKGYPYPPGAHEHPARATGAEHNMAWQYHTLEIEGALPGAFVPQWFKQRGWLDFYADSRHFVQPTALATTQ